MHPKKKLMYKVDGEYLKMQPQKHKIKVKLNSWLRVPISRKSYKTIFGNALESKDGKFYAVKMNANEEIRSGEQWYRMGLAQNFDQFEKALKMDAFAMLNVFYADIDDNIYFLSQGHYPVRNPDFNYEDLVPGNTRSTLWQGMVDFDDRPTLLNPDCGFIFNANNTPLHATCDNDNIEEAIKNKIIGLQYNETNRGQRFKEIFDTLTNFNYQILKDIKYDLKYPENGLLVEGIERLKILNTGEDSLTNLAMQLLTEWDKSSDYENRGASFALVFFKFFFGLIDGGPETFFIRNKNPEFEIIKKTAHSSFDHFNRHFSGEIVPLKDIQRHRRGDKDLPVRGSLDVLAALDTRLHKDGRFVARAGDSFIGFVTLNKNGISSETIVPYGASDREDSPHFYDQMEMYLNQKTKKMVIDKEGLLRKPHKIYHPE
jgi:acyl-homoserine-lactone acylase